LILIIILFTFTNFLHISNVKADLNDIQINIIYPKENQAIPYTNPEIKVEFTSLSIIDIDKTQFIVDGLNIIEYDSENIEIGSNFLTYTPSEVFRFKNGNHTIFLQLEDIDGKKNSTQWTFIIDTSITITQEGKIDVFTIIKYMIIGSIIGSIIFAIYIFYLKKTKKFTFKKYFIQHPMAKEYIILYMPIIIAFIFIMLGFLYVSTTEGISPYSYEYVFIISFLIAIGPYAIRSQYEKRNLQKYERAFAQLLFEMADAMRGGLDPTKAIIELAKTDTSIMKIPLKRAAEAIKIGRPFDEVIKIMARPFNSDLIQRYASLIGEASKVGGETSQVIYRAAKDMDDFIKINADRKRELTMQTTTIYISFSVMIIIIYLLLTMFPRMEGIDLSLLGSVDLESAEAATSSSVERLSDIIIKQRFFHVILINSIGTGIVIGEFVDGKIKYGLIHSLILIAASTIFFTIMIL
jgi:pilus assembly protein TadC